MSNLVRGNPNVNHNRYVDEGINNTRIQTRVSSQPPQVPANQVKYDQPVGFYTDVATFNKYQELANKLYSQVYSFKDAQGNVYKQRLIAQPEIHYLAKFAMDYLLDNFDALEKLGGSKNMGAMVNNLLSQLGQMINQSQNQKQNQNQRR